MTPNFLKTPLAGLALLAGIAGSFAQDAPVGQAVEPVTPTPPPAQSPWQNTVGFGFTLVEGTVDSLMLTLNGVSRYTNAHNELTMVADVKYGKADDKINVNQQFGSLQYNRLLTDRWYVYGRVSGLHDEIADIDYRVPLSIGAGYYFIKSDRIRLSAETGPGVQWQRLFDQEGDVFATWRFADNFEWKITDKTKFWQKAEYVPQLDDFGNYYILAEAGIETALVGGLSLRTYVQDNYQNRPAKGANNNEFMWITGVAYKF